MNRMNDSLKLIRRALLVTLVVATPVMAIHGVRAADTTTIEAPTMKNRGAGLVLMVSLQRS
ncbi:MAG: hypothetical protein KKB66_05275 [Alphaproteobacteria bacterium]|jgi:hypothetical protein|nr:hypothetical protein [Alphaproteobacteria bacterium]MBU0803120.1 hypothetical protein [Alphaproteobacteria bacterium]MBU0873808.1 hypothetical protein [Alphaproteobacteria bacterium]MBU1400692.1 hypothetical protein [Alphaproteobacteria bacterium]MBU1590565.1 hypothetical protein [Alphaproteobacteria bacterium]